MSTNDLFDAAFRKKTEHLSLVARKIISGMVRGQDQPSNKGTTTEFQDYRSYCPGDDFRAIDWNLYRRLDELFVKVYKSEQQVRMVVLLDTSSSMNFGQNNKLDYARQLAAALCVIGMANMDRVDLIPFCSHLHSGLRSMAGSGKTEALYDILRKLKPSGTTDMTQAFRSYVAAARKKSLVFVISDLYDMDRYATALKLLRAQRNDLYLLHVIDQDDQQPDIRGTTSLIDSETGRRREVTVTSKVLREYLEMFAAHCRQADRFCRANDIGYAPAGTDIPFDKLILQLLRRGALAT
jgi:uncharacterized protein (DUF58 family)